MTPKRIALTLITASAIVALSAGAVACGDDDDDEAPAGEETAATGDTTEDTAAVESATEDVLAVLRERDQDRLRDLTGDQLQQRVRDQDFQRLATCVPEGATVDLISREVEISGDTATVTVTLEITTADGETSEVEKVWEFERQDDGTWALSQLPECPFQ